MFKPLEIPCEAYYAKNDLNLAIQDHFKSGIYAEQTIRRSTPSVAPKCACAGSVHKNFFSEINSSLINCINID